MKKDNKTVKVAPKVRDKRSENKHRNDELRRMRKERDRWKHECKKAREELKRSRETSGKARRVREAVERSREKVRGHGYSSLQADIAVKIRCNTSCSARDVSSILEILNESTGGLLDDGEPCANTIDNWANKCGLDAYGKAGGRLGRDPYAMIIDDSMVFGGQRLLLVLLVPAAHGGRPLAHGDVAVGGIYVAESIDSEYIKNALEETAAKVGRDPEYVVSDNASVMRKGIGMAGMRRHSDITHSLGMLLERTYKREADFSDFAGQVADVSFKCGMLPVAYLLPPKQRAVARFMNMGGWVDWASAMLGKMGQVPAGYRDAFSFIPRNASLIDELSDVMSCVRYIESAFKHGGLSPETAAKCMGKVDRTLMRGNERMRSLGTAIKRFLGGEAERTEGGARNNSSDIIESTYGTYKSKKSPNKMYGVTTLALRLSLCGKTLGKDFDAARSLTSVKMRDIQEWKRKNLLPNPMSKRLKFFKKTA